MCFQERSLTQVFFWFKKIAFIKINQERGGRRDYLVSPEDDLAIHDERKINKRMKIKHKHTEFESSRISELKLLWLSLQRWITHSIPLFSLFCSKLKNKEEMQLLRTI